MLSHSEDFMILSYVVLTQYSSVADRQTGRQKDTSAVAKTRYSITCCRANNYFVHITLTFATCRLQPVDCVSD